MLQCAAMFGLVDDKGFGISLVFKKRGCRPSKATRRDSFSDAAVEYHCVRDSLNDHHRIPLLFVRSLPLTPCTGSGGLGPGLHSICRLSVQLEIER